MRSFLFGILYILSTQTTAQDVINLGNCAGTAKTMIFSKLEIHCGNPELEKRFNSLPDLSLYNKNMGELLLLREKVGMLEEDIKKAERSVGQTEAASLEKIASTQTQLVEHQSSLRDLIAEHKNLRFNLATRLTEVRNESEKSLGEAIESTKEAFITYVNQKLEQLSLDDFESLERSLHLTERRLDLMDSRIQRLEHSLKFFATEYFNGRYRQRTSFIGIGIGAINNDSEWHTKISIDYEVFLADPLFWGIRGSYFIEFASLDWTLTSSFETLPGLPNEVQTENNSFAYAGLGSRIYFSEIFSGFRPYSGAVIGLSVNGREDTAYFGLLAGVDYFRVSARTSLELRWDWFSEIEETRLEFNPIGDAQSVSVKEGISTLYLGVRISFR